MDVMKRRLLVIFLLIFLAVAGYSIEISSYDIFTGLIWIGNSETNSAPSPIVPSPGFAISIRFNDFIYLAPGLTFYGYQYGYPENVDRPVPVEIEHREIYVFGVNVTAELTFQFDFSEKLSGGFLVSPSLMCKIPTFPLVDNLDADIPGQMAGYFFGAVRFLLPEAGGFLRWNAFDNFGIVFRLKTGIPVFHLWDCEGTPFYDQMTINFTVGLSFPR